MSGRRCRRLIAERAKENTTLKSKPTCPWIYYLAIKVLYSRKTFFRCIKLEGKLTYFDGVTFLSDCLMLP